MKWIWRPVLGALLVAAPPATAQAQEPDPAELAEARAIVAVMFPPDERDQMIQTLIEQIASQLEQVTPFDVESFGDAGLTNMVANFRAELVGVIMPTVQTHLPKILEATATAYTNEFDLAELRDIRAFSETPSGRRYLSRSTALVGDPAVAEANTVYFRAIRTIAEAKQAEFTEQLRAYFTKYPELARRVAEARQGK